MGVLPSGNPRTFSEVARFFRIINERLSELFSIHGQQLPRGGIKRKSSSFAFSSGEAVFSDSSGSWVDVPKLSLTITTTGNPVFVGLMNFDEQARGYIGASKLGPTAGLAYDADFRASRDGNIAWRGLLSEKPAALNVTDYIYVPAGAVSFLDAPSAGSHTYKMQAKSGTETSALVQGVKMFAYEI